MGGKGSGHWCRWDARPIVEDYRCLDVDRWHRDGLLRPGHGFSWCWWRDSDRTQKVANINVLVTDGRVVLSYRCRYGGGDWHDVTKSVPLTWTLCNYGGRRPWFVCPGVVNGVVCGRRVRKLYCAGRYFLCRHCYGLAYESQRESPLYRALRRTQEIRLRLGGSGSLAEPFPVKPKGMHWRTYWRLRREAEEAFWEMQEGVAALL